MAYRFRLTDRLTQQVTHVDDAHGMAALVRSGIDAAVEIVDHHGNVVSGHAGGKPRYDRVEPDGPKGMAESFQDTIANLPVDSIYGKDADTAYTEGDCDVFAVALARLMPDGMIVGIVEMPGDEDTEGDRWESDGEDEDEEAGDPLDEDRGYVEEDEPPLLAHAGLLLGDTVIDVRGAHDRERWMFEWAERTEGTWRFEILDQEDLERMQKEAMKEEDIEQAMRVARLVAIANGQDVEPEPSLTFAA